MANLEIRFVTGNKYKAEEAMQMLSAAGFNVLKLDIKLDELQTEDTQLLVKDKTLKAFQRVGRPLFVEHTGLYLSHLNGLPGGLTEIFWNRLQADRFSDLFGSTDDPSVTARTLIGYTDGKQFYSFEGTIQGRIAASPSGPRDFQWDCVFIPDGDTRTFAEMGDEKNLLSMRRRALDKMAGFLSQQGRV
jgi:XTP/dITP diphosphohydrolase